eukprot:XP_011440804.1 PREDICTED: uncharacterized protein LOC105337665 [Crassostrea gigas]
MLRLLVLSCALSASLGNYAGKQGDPNPPIDPRDVRNVVPGLKPGDIITPVSIDNIQIGSEGLPWVDESPINPFIIDQTPVINSNINARPLDLNDGRGGQVYENPFVDGSGLPNKRKPSYDGSRKVPVPPVTPPNGYGGGIARPDFHVDPGRKVPSYVNSNKVSILSVENPFGQENSPFGPIDGPGFDPLSQNIPLRTAPSYDGSQKVPIPVGENQFGQENSPFGPFGGAVVDPLNPNIPLRKAPSYDGSNKGPIQVDENPFVPFGGAGVDPLIPNIPLRKAPGYDGSNKGPIQVDENPFVPFGGAGVDPLNPNIPLRKAPSYDGSHKGPILAVENPFGPFVGAGVDSLNPNIPLRKAPSYDGSHKGPILAGENSFGQVNSPFVPFGGADVDPLIPNNRLPLPDSNYVDRPYPDTVTDQRQQFDEMVSARLRTNTGLSPQVLPDRKGLSEGKRNYLSSLGLFKKAKSYKN